MTINRNANKIFLLISNLKTKAEVAAMENTPAPIVDPIAVCGTELMAEPQIQPLAPTILKPEPVLDPTDLSDTTESEAEKHGCKYKSLKCNLAALAQLCQEFLKIKRTNAG